MSTAVPGHAICSSKRKQTITMTASPSHARPARVAGAMRRTCEPSTASSAPASSSPIRVGNR